MPASFAKEVVLMDLLLWRHAEAEEGLNDFERALTMRGEKQAKSVARWLLQHRPSPSSNSMDAHGLNRCRRCRLCSGRFSNVV